MRCPAPPIPAPIAATMRVDRGDDPFHLRPKGRKRRIVFLGERLKRRESIENLAGIRYVLCMMVPKRRMVARNEKMKQVHVGAQVRARSGKNAAPLILGSDGRYFLEYVPFEHVNAEARLVIVGITPGPNQRNDAYDETRQLLRRGLTDEEILRNVKKHAAFGGPAMRPNLERMLDAMGAMTLLGGGRAAELWAGRAHLLHATSAVPHAAFVGGKPFARSFEEIQRVDLLLH